jgi:hypothetical protein
MRESSSSTSRHRDAEDDDMLDAAHDDDAIDAAGL